MSREALENWIRANPVEGNPAQMRAAFEKLAGSTAQGREVVLNGVSGRAFGSGRQIVWLHGGGYVFGSSRSHAAAAALLADRAGACVLVPDYRRAPEHPWPAAFDDACAFVSGCKTPVAIVGDSAGGHLALNVARRLPEMIAALALISPNTDRTGLSRTRATNTQTDLMNSDADDADLAALAMGHLFPVSHDVSPLRADLTRLPPTFVTASRNEVLFDDARLLVEALKQQGVKVAADFLEDMFHLWPLWPDFLPQARRTAELIAEFFALNATDATHELVGR